MERSTVPRPAERDAWLAARRPYFNASATSVLWDRHPYLTPGAYAVEKLAGAHQSVTRAMEMGTRFEEPVARWWADEAGVEVYQPDELYIAGRLMASLDRRVVGTDEVVEVKCTTRYVREPLLYWLDQCQAQCLAADVAGVHLVWMDASLDYAHYWVERDEAWGAEIARGAEWWMSFIDMGMEPEGVKLTYEETYATHPVAEVAKVELDGEGRQWVVALVHARHTRLAAERDEERIRAEVAARIGDAEEGWWNGESIVTWRNDRPTYRFDAKAHAAAERTCHGRFMVPKAPVRRLLPVGPGEETTE